MKHKRYYLVLLLVLCSSIVLLGLSYSSYSGEENYIINEIKQDDFKIVYSSSNIIKSDEELEIGITNLSNSNRKYRIFIKETNNDNNTIYYSINNSDKKELLNNTIIVDDISAYGTKGDYKYNKITLYSSNKTTTFNIDVVESNEVSNDSE